MKAKEILSVHLIRLSLLWYCDQFHIFVYFYFSEYLLMIIYRYGTRHNRRILLQAQLQVCKRNAEWESVEVASDNPRLLRNTEKQYSIKHNIITHTSYENKMPKCSTVYTHPPLHVCFCLQFLGKQDA